MKTPVPVAAPQFSPRAEVPAVLAELRRRIRRYVLLEGSALVAVVLGIVFWLSLGLDYWLDDSQGGRRDGRR